MTQFAVISSLLANAAFSALAQEDLGGPVASEEKAHALLQHKAEVESASHSDDSADVSIDSEDSKVLEGMDKPEEEEMPAEEPEVHDQVHDLDDHDGLSESEKLALAEIDASDPGPLPNLTQSLIDSESEKLGMEKFGDATDEIIVPPEEQGESANVVNDPQGSYTPDQEELKNEDHVQDADFGQSDEPLMSDDGTDGKEGYQDLHNANETVSGLEVRLGLKPETGDHVPEFAQSFPGCGCDFQEYSKKWTCSGTIALPKSVSGKECCCCTMSCDRRSRCDHETCDAINIDQRAEVEAYEKARKKRLGDADAFLCGTKLYKVPIGAGRCSNSRNLAACRKVGKYPLCDHSSYAGRGKQCYFPRGKKPCEGRHFSHIGHLRASQKEDSGFELMDFYGMCFVANNGDHTLFPNGEGHNWNNHGGAYTLNDPGTANRMVARYTVPDLDNQRVLGGWHTYCVNESPN
jgi:hypothetical protein